MVEPSGYCTPFHPAPSDCHFSHSWAVPWHQQDAAVAKLTTRSDVISKTADRQQTPDNDGSKGEKGEGGKEGGHLKIISHGKIQNLRPKSIPQ